MEDLTRIDVTDGVGGPVIGRVERVRRADGTLVATVILTRPTEHGDALTAGAVRELLASPRASEFIAPDAADFLGQAKAAAGGKKRRDHRCATCGERFKVGGTKCQGCGTRRDGTTRPRGKGGSQTARLSSSGA